MSTDALTARECGRLGWMVEKVEHWATYEARRHDLFRIFDQLAVTPEGVVVFIQTTTRSNASSRRKKMQSASVLPRLLKNPNVEVELWTWQGTDLRRETITEAPGSGVATARGASGKPTSSGTRSSSTPATRSSIDRLHGR